MFLINIAPCVLTACRTGPKALLPGLKRVRTDITCLEIIMSTYHLPFKQILTSIKHIGSGTKTDIVLVENLLQTSLRQHGVMHVGTIRVFRSDSLVLALSHHIR